MGANTALEHSLGHVTAMTSHYPSSQRYHPLGRHRRVPVAVSLVNDTGATDDDSVLTSVVVCRCSSVSDTGRRWVAVVVETLRGSRNT